MAEKSITKALCVNAIHFNVKQDNQVVKKVVYVAIGVKIDGVKEVLGFWGGANKL